MRTVWFIIAVASFALSLTTPTSGLKCRNGYMRRSEERSTPFGYCWFYLPGNRPITNALYVCNNMFQGRLPAVNTAEKARKLGEFITLEAGMYERGELGNNWGSFFRNGNKGTSVWISPQHAQGAHMAWNQTDYRVALRQQEKGQPHHVTGEACVVFTADTQTWKYVDCTPTTTYALLCEEGGHGNDDDDEGSWDTPAPAPVAAAVAAAVPVPAADEPEVENGRDEYYDEEESGVCPAGFQLFEEHCFKLGTGAGHGIRAAKSFCKKHGAHLVRINDVNKEAVVKEYLKEHLSADSQGAFLDSVHFSGDKMVWTANDASAAFIKANIQGRGGKGARPIFFTRAGGQIRYCPRRTKRQRCIRTALCETTPQREEE